MTCEHRTTIAWLAGLWPGLLMAFLEAKSPLRDHRSARADNYEKLLKQFATDGRAGIKEAIELMQKATTRESRAKALVMFRAVMFVQYPKEFPSLKMPKLKIQKDAKQTLAAWADMTDDIPDKDRDDGSSRKRSFWRAVFGLKNAFSTAPK